MERSKQSPGPFSPSPIWRLVYRTPGGGWERETVTRPAPTGPSGLTGHSHPGAGTPEMTASLMDSTAVIHVRMRPRVEIFTAGNHTWPQSISVYFAA